MSQILKKEIFDAIQDNPLLQKMEVLSIEKISNDKISKIVLRGFLTNFVYSLVSVTPIGTGLMKTSLKKGDHVTFFSEHIDREEFGANWHFRARKLESIEGEKIESISLSKSNNISHLYFELYLTKTSN